MKQMPKACVFFINESIILIEITCVMHMDDQSYWLYIFAVFFRVIQLDYFFFICSLLCFSIKEKPHSTYCVSLTIAFFGCKEFLPKIPHN